MIERLKKYIDSKDFSVRDFESQCELREGVIKMALKNKGDIGSDKLGKILTKFPDINIEWLLTGVGEMILEKGQKNGHYISLLDSKLPVPLENQFVFPFLGDASAGFIVEYYEHEAYMESFQLPFQKGQIIGFASF